MAPAITHPVKRDDLGDLLAYRPLGLLSPRRSEFLRGALERIERGWHAYTCTVDDRLVHVGWLRVVPETSGEYGVDSPPELPAGSVVLAGFMSHPGSLGLGLQQASIARMLQDSAAMYGDGQVYAVVSIADTPSRRALEEAGFRAVFSLVERVRSDDGSSQGKARTEPSTGLGAKGRQAHRLWSHHEKSE
jgi:hypothetical protein